MLAAVTAAPGERSNPAGIPYLRLANGEDMPQLGFGVWQVPNEDVTAAVGEAIRAGYRLIDTAQGYGNEEGVGLAIARSGMRRRELFVASKLRTGAMGYDAALAGIEASLTALGLAYLDMFLIHWPAPARDRYVETWRAFIAAQERGLVRTIGVSNFLPEHIERLVAETGVVPAVNQIELHPHFQQREVRAFHARHGIQLQSYSPLGSGSVLDDPVLVTLGQRHGKSPAQVIVRWHLQQGLVAIPKSVTPERIRSNLDVFNFELTAEDMDLVASLDRPDGRTGSDPATYNDLF